MSKKITPCLWFENDAEQAIDYYAAVFKNFKVVTKSFYGPGAPLPEGTLLTAVLQIEDEEFMLLNGGPFVKFNEAVSFVVDCADQAEVDYYWQKLTADGGEEGQCGWLKDRFGLSWQIVPRALNELLQDKDAEKAGRVMQAMLKMHKIDVAELQAAYDKRP